MTVLTKLSKSDAQEVLSKINGVRLCVQFALPEFPVSLRSCFNNAVRNGRIDTPRYKTWKRETDAALARKPRLCGTSLKATIIGRVAVSYSVQQPDRRKRDLDNLLKSLNDALSRNHIIEDDSKIVDLRIKWAPKDSFDGAVLVEIFQEAA